MSLEKLPGMCPEHKRRFDELLTSGEIRPRRNLLIGGLLEETDYCGECGKARSADDPWFGGESMQIDDLFAAEWFLSKYLKHERATTYFCFEHLRGVVSVAAEVRASKEDRGTPAEKEYWHRRL